MDRRISRRSIRMIGQESIAYECIDRHQRLGRLAVNVQSASEWYSSIKARVMPARAIIVPIADLTCQSEGAVFSCVPIHVMALFNVRSEIARDLRVRLGVRRRRDRTSRNFNLADLLSLHMRHKNAVTRFCTIDRRCEHDCTCMRQSALR